MCKHSPNTAYVRDNGNGILHNGKHFDAVEPGIEQGAFSSIHSGSLLRMEYADHWGIPIQNNGNATDCRRKEKTRERGERARERE